MTEKRFNVFDVDGTIFLEDHKEGSYHIGEIGNVDVNCLNDIAYRLNELHEEKEQLTKENNELKEELHEFKEYVFSDEKILCYSCVNCISKGIYEVECSEKGKVDVHSSCFSYWLEKLRDKE